ncbi:hypothetical protein [uncultured Nostoc sp.]
MMSFELITDAINRVSPPNSCTDAINRVSPNSCTDAINRVSLFFEQQII